MLESQLLNETLTQKMNDYERLNLTAYGMNTFWIFNLDIKLLNLNLLENEKEAIIVVSYFPFSLCL